MAYHSKYRQRRRLARMSERQRFAAEGEDLARKAAVDLVAVWATRATANYFCTRPQPDYVLCNVSYDLANKQEKKAGDSLLAFGVWGFVALLATIL